MKTYATHCAMECEFIKCVGYGFGFISGERLWLKRKCIDVKVRR